MTKRTYAAPRGISRRGFLAGSAAFGGAMTLPGATLAQAEGQLLLWLPGGSDLFCQIHTGLLEGFSSAAGLGPATTVCGLGQDTEFTQALIGSITAAGPCDMRTRNQAMTKPSRVLPASPMNTDAGWVL